MKVICDNCGAMYKIPDEKLVKPVNKATCRQCGHRMLIPRPRRGADPDERTLVTAVPPTPAPPPLRSDDGPPTNPIVEHEEKTAPTGGRTAAAVDETRWVRNDIGRAQPRPRAAAAVSAAPAHTERIPAHQAAAYDGYDQSSPYVTPQPDRQSATPAPAPVEPQRPRAAARPEPAPAPTPIPEPVPDPQASARTEYARPEPAPAAPAHDPRGDMGLALFGVLVAGLGITTLAVLSVVDATWSYGLVLALSALGTLFAVGGGVGAFLVLVTSGRGRKPAWRFASVALAIVAALLVAGLPAIARIGVDISNGIDGAISERSIGDLLASMGGEAADVDEPDDRFAAMADEQDEPEPPQEDISAVADEGTDAGGVAALDEGTEEPEVVEEADEGSDEPETTPTASTTTSTRSSGTSTRSSGTRSSTRSSGTRSSTRSSGTTSGTRSATTTSATSSRSFMDDDQGSSNELSDEEELDLPDEVDLSGPSSTPARSNLPATPPLSAIDIMVKSNKDVKRCFFDEMRSAGSLPSKVDLRFTIRPNGDATSISIKQSKFSGSELESCLIRSVRRIAFPPSQDGTTLTFPFVFDQ